MNVLQDFSVTVQRNDMRFGGIVAPKSGCLSLTLGLCSSFTFGVVSALYSPDLALYSNVQQIKIFKRS